jgi:hypothetical protein
MSSTQLSGDAAREASGPATALMRFEVTTLPVADVDRATRRVQFTPPGSPASIQFGQDTTSMTGPLEGLPLIVDDIEAARDELIGRGVDVSGLSGRV